MDQQMVCALTRKVNQAPRVQLNFFVSYFFHSYPVLQEYSVTQHHYSSLVARLLGYCNVILCLIFFILIQFSRNIA